MRAAFLRLVKSGLAGRISFGGAAVSHVAMAAQLNRT
jgi:DNA-binding GntR family transcriptional regulator